jgi:predicted nucleic acid-binding protein
LIPLNIVFRFLADWPTFTAIEPHRVSSLLPTLHRAHILRGADSIQLATALVARSLAQGEEIIFATADERLAKAAKDEGLTIIP